MDFDRRRKRGVMFFRVGDEGNFTALIMGEDEEEIDRMRRKLTEITKQELHQ